MNFSESPLLIQCRGSRMLGILSRPGQTGQIGVLVIVGGPQYRAGSHRQFTLLARHLAGAGFPTLRFDHRGMGDSEGDMRSFESIGEDIRAALEAFFATTPGLCRVVLWGLCDAASAALFYAPTDRRVAGLVLLNPWIHTEAGAARALLWHYYPRRLVSPAFWRKALGGRLNIPRVLASLKDQLAAARGVEKAATPADGPTAPPGADLPARMLDGLNRFDGKLLLILSGQDYTAHEFRDRVAADPGWRKALAAFRPRQVILEEADHVFSSGTWRDRVAHETLAWLHDFSAETLCTR